MLLCYLPYFLDQMLPIVFGSNHRIFTIAVCRFERRWHQHFCFLGVPFHLKKRKTTITFLYIINLLLLGGTPKISIAIALVVMVVFQTLAYHKVFPQSTYIIPKLQGTKVLDYGIANAVIVKENLFTFLKLRSEVPTQSR